MATIIEKTGKTVEEAFQAALSELGVNEEDVEMEVLEKPSKGILGFFGNKPARIKVTLKEVPKAEIVTENASETPTTINFRVVPSLDTLPTVEEEPDNAENPVEVKVDVESNTESEVDDVPKLESEIKVDGENKVDAESEIVTPAATDDTELAENIVTFDRAEIIDRAKKFLFDVFAAMNVEVKIDISESDENVILNLTEKKSAALIGKHGQNLDALQYLTNLAANKDSEDKVRFILNVGDYRERREIILKKMAKSAADRVVRTRKEVKLEPMSRHERLIIHTALQDHKRVETHSYGNEPGRHIVVSLKKKNK